MNKERMREEMRATKKLGIKSKKLAEFLSRWDLPFTTREWIKIRTWVLRDWK